MTMIERKVWVAHFGHAEEADAQINYSRALKRNNPRLWRMTIYPRFERLVFWERIKVAARSLFALTPEA